MINIAFRLEVNLTNGMSAQMRKQLHKSEHKGKDGMQQGLAEIKYSLVGDITNAYDTYYVLDSLSINSQNLLEQSKAGKLR